MTILREKKREWDMLRETEKITYVLRDKLKTRPFFLKGTQPPVEFVMGEITDNSIEFFTMPGLPARTQITLYLTVNRHIEVDFDVKEIREDRWILWPTQARIGRAVRAHPRYMTRDGAVYATNFKVSKNEIGADFSKLQIASQVVLRDHEKQIAEEFPGLKFYLPNDKERLPELKPLENVNTPVIIKDTQDPAAYEIPLGDSTYKKQLEMARAFENVRLRLSGTASFIVFPVNIEEKGKTYLIAHIYLPLKNPGADFEKILATLTEKCDTITERIREVNMITIKEKQRVHDISLGGLGLEITNEDLKKYVPLSDRITFDLIFKMQAPLRFQGKICHVASDDEGEKFVAGIDIEGSGHSDYRKSNQERLNTMIQTIKLEDQ
ncbi:MAG: DUF1577 domain-containing protein [Leptospirales bacterium]|nr:DUF1577 domain-containing protein [Leptospirales bacterium]